VDRTHQIETNFDLGENLLRTSALQSKQVTIEAANHPTSSLAEDVRRGLTSKPKKLFPKYFYDERGSKLFEQICELPEYYQTRTERKILELASPLIAKKYKPAVLVEYGAGAATKTRLLLDAMRDKGSLKGFVPIDVSADFLKSVAQQLAQDYPKVFVHGLTGDFIEPIQLPHSDEPRLIAFLGSTIGNLNDTETDDFLHLITSQMTGNDHFLLGTDLIKDTATLEAAYDDSQGVTAEFNKNILQVINRELNGNFNPDNFAHVAVYNREEAQVEIYLESMLEQTVKIKDIDLDVRFDVGETIRTEISCKYDKARVNRLLRSAGLVMTDWFTDEDNLFAVSISQLQSSVDSTNGSTIP